MSHTIFISHAGVDTPRAQVVADRLTQASLQVILDRDELQAGDSFLSFMEDALHQSDYCLLLWSKAASKSRWVQVEWEAAYYRTIQEARRFLIVGRLEDLKPPRLLAPRLRIDLFPNLHSRLAALIDMVHEDDDAANASGRLIGQAAVPIDEDDQGETVYLTSELFSLTMPIKLDFEVPSGTHLDRIRADLNLPAQFDHQGKLGVRMDYRLVHEEKVLSRSESLAAQGVAPKDVIWLEVEMKPYAANLPISGELQSAIFRGESTTESRGVRGTDSSEADARRAARQALLSSLSRAGLGF